VLYEDTAFVALTILVSLNEDYAWYLLTYSRAGQPLGQARVGAFSEHDGNRYEHWSEITSALAIEQGSLFRYFNKEGVEEACTRTRWRWRIGEDGRVDTSGEELNEEC
jgi:hypothetical protein